MQQMCGIKDSSVVGTAFQLYRRAGKEALLNDGMNTPITVDHLRDAEVNCNRDEGDCLVLGQSFCRHQETPHLAKSVLEGEIDGRLFVDLLLCLGAKLFEIIGETEAVNNPFILGFQQGVIQFGERADERIFLVQDELEGASKGAFNSSAAQL